MNTKQNPEGFFMTSPPNHDQEVINIIADTLSCAYHAGANPDITGYAHILSAEILCDHIAPLMAREFPREKVIEILLHTPVLGNAGTDYSQTLDALKCLFEGSPRLTEDDNILEDEILDKAIIMQQEQEQDKPKGTCPTCKGGAYTIPCPDCGTGECQHKGVIKFLAPNFPNPPYYTQCCDCQQVINGPRSGDERREDTRKSTIITWLNYNDRRILADRRISPPSQPTLADVDASRRLVHSRPRPPGEAPSSRPGN